MCPQHSLLHRLPSVSRSWWTLNPSRVALGVAQGAPEAELAVGQCYEREGAACHWWSLLRTSAVWEMWSLSGKSLAGWGATACHCQYSSSSQR